MRHPKADTAAQHAFREKIERYERDKWPVVYIPVVYIDESGFAHDIPRTHGYAPKGQRCLGTHDWNAKGRVNVIGALLAGVLLSVGLPDANVDADMFNLWLRPTRRRSASLDTSLQWARANTQRQSQNHQSAG